MAIAFIVADARHDAEALRLDEDLAFGAFFGTDLVAIAIVSAEEPRTIPAGFSVASSISLTPFKILADSASFLKSLAISRVFFAILHGHAGDEDALGDARFFVGGRLEALAWGSGEAIEVEAIVPIGPAD
jgi:hypothetical protein